MSRTIEQLVVGTPTSDGAGVKLTRLLTHTLQKRLDPFLMLDHFRSDDPDDYIAGFPDHPHRGFETVTYMLKGRMLHHDSVGNKGMLEDGGMQWMSAARGVIHSEIPQQDEGLMSGFQLWINLPARHKLDDPWYRDFTKAELPTFSTEDASITVVAGSSHGTKGAVERPDTLPSFLDIQLKANGNFEQAIPRHHNGFIVVYEGEASVGDRNVVPGKLAILANDGDSVRIHSKQGAKLLLISGQPLNETIVQYGPFVMNSEAEIHQAIQDFRAGTFAN